MDEWSDADVSSRSSGVMSCFQKRRAALLWVPLAVVGMALYFGSFVHSLTVNGMSLIGIALSGAAAGLLVADVEGRLPWVRS